MAGSPRKPLMIGGVAINFPFKPYPSQLMMMSGAIKALSRKESALLESPTGSGKTMALLCSTLAWQRNEAANLEAIHRIETTLKPEAPPPTLSARKPKTSAPAAAAATASAQPGANPLLASTELDFLPEAEPPQSLMTLDPVRPNSGGSLAEQASGAPGRKHARAEKNSDAAVRRIEGSTGTGPRGSIHSTLSDSDDDDFKAPTSSKGSGGGEHRAKRHRRSSDSASVGSDGVASATPHLRVGEAGPAQTEPKGKPAKCPKPPRIYFGTRTHKQITQVVRELKRSGYGKTTRMCVLSSREHSCVHPQVSKAGGKNEECRKLHHEQEKGGAGCGYHQNLRSLSYHPAFKPYGKHAVWDIEDLVKVGKKVKGCPYYAAKDMLNSADIVFAPYNYLIDPHIRKAMLLDVTDSVIIIDEAHNIEDSARESASLTLPVDTFNDAVTELSVMFAVSADDPCLSSLVSVTTALLAWLRTTGDAFSSAPPDNGPGAGRGKGRFDESAKVLTGRQASVVFENFGITKVTVEVLMKQFTEYLTAEAELQQSDEVSGNKMGSRTVGTLTSLLQVLEFLLCGGDARLDDYKVVVERKSVLVERDGHSVRELQLCLGFWCLNPAVAYSSMADRARTVILTSGTMSPLNTFASELGSTFPHTVEANHIIKSDQVWAGTLSTAASGRKMHLTYRDVDTFDLQDDVGSVVLRTCQTVPAGVLLFAPSYGLLDKLINRWKNTGVWKQLAALKVVVTEPQNGSKHDFETKLKKYYQAIKAHGNGKARHTGGLFLAVIRGKVSEGLDFADDNARAVISLGIPFPNARDQNVLMKKEYNTKWAKQRGLMNGDRWYETQAFRALNQGLGRCIRHRNDWGAILIVDCRFASKDRYTNAISKWVRQRLVHHGKFDSAMASLEQFVARRVAPPAHEGALPESVADVKPAVLRQGPASETVTPAGGSKSHTTISSWLAASTPASPTSPRAPVTIAYDAAPKAAPVASGQAVNAGVGSTEGGSCDSSAPAAPQREATAAMATSMEVPPPPPPPLSAPLLQNWSSTRSDLISRLRRPRPLVPG
eukprot:m.362541 g.362541  ORF g.362541 m.362541 type:complete len:1056 (-) comp16651_c0_seq2:2355-5522(-)